MKDVAKLLKKNIFETISLENVRVEADGLGKALETIKVLTITIVYFHFMHCIFRAQVI